MPPHLTISLVAARVQSVLWFTIAALIFRRIFRTQWLANFRSKRCASASTATPICPR
jgi:hypothetical protein